MKYNQLTPAQRQTIKEQLNKAENMHDFLMYLSIVFDMKECRPGITTKQILSNSMINVVLPMINPDVK